MIGALMVLAIGVVLALTSWNAHRTGELLGPFYDLIEREDPRFQFYLNMRFGVAAVVIMLGALVIAMTLFPPR